MKKYQITFIVYYSGKTGKIINEIWCLKVKRFWILPWKIVPSPLFHSYEEVLEWAKETFGDNIDISYNHYGEERRV